MVSELIGIRLTSVHPIHSLEFYRAGYSEVITRRYLAVGVIASPILLHPAVTRHKN